MSTISVSIFEALLLTLALSTDAFAASLGYGADHIRIPPVSVGLISGICSLMLGVSLLVGTVIRPYLPDWMAKWLCFSILFLLGVIKLFDITIKSYLKKRKQLRKHFSFSALHMNFIVSVYANPQEADRDASRTLAPIEAIPLAFAMSLDGLAVGFGAAFDGMHIWMVISASLLFGVLAILSGSALGNRLAQKTSFDLSWLSGVILIFLSVSKLF